MEKKYSSVKIAAYVGGRWHEFNYANSSVRDALEQYGWGGDVQRFVNCWDYWSHPIDVTLPGGSVVRLMHNICMADYFYNKWRMGFDEYLKWMTDARAWRDAAPYLWHVIKQTRAYEVHDAYVSQQDAEWRFKWYGEEVLLRHGYTLADESTSTDGKGQLWHKDGQDDVNVELVRMENNIYRDRKAV